MNKMILLAMAASSLILWWCWNNEKIIKTKGQILSDINKSLSSEKINQYWLMQWCNSAWIYIESLNKKELSKKTRELIINIEKTCHKKLNTKKS